jgi:hypothetical protein
MKKSLIILLMLLCKFSFATHMLGGFISLQHVSGYTYKVRFVSYTNEGPNIQADRCYVNIHFSDGDSLICDRINGLPGSCAGIATMGQVIANSVKYNVYEGVKTFNNPGDYLAWADDPNRSDGIVNIPGSINAPFYIETFISVVDPNLYCPISSIEFGQLPVLSNPVNTPFEFNLPIVKTQNDSISYQLETCRQYNNVPVIGYTYPTGISFNTDYGKFIMSAIAAQGKYGIAARVNKWRNGVLVSYTLVDFTFMLNGALSNTIQMPINSNLVANSDSVYVGNFSINDTITITNFNTSNYVVSLYSEINDSLITQINSGNTTQFSIANLSSLERKQPYKLTLRAIDNPMTNNIGKDFIFLFTIGNNNLINCTLPQDLGSSAININDIQLYPNPVNNQLYFANVPANSTIQVYNLQGQVTIDKQLKTSELNMNELKQGLYFYKLFDQHGVNIKSGKIVKD